MSTKKLRRVSDRPDQTPSQKEKKRKVKKVITSRSSSIPMFRDLQLRWDLLATCRAALRSPNEPRALAAPIVVPMGAVDVLYLGARPLSMQTDGDSRAWITRGGSRKEKESHFWRYR